MQGSRVALPVLALLVSCGGPSRAPAAPQPPQFMAQAGDLAIVHVAVVDVIGGQLLPDHTVVVRGSEIVAVGEAARVSVPDGVQTIDGAGLYLMPGLADMHAHSWLDSDLTLFVAAGVTTVRNMFGAPTHLDWRARTAAGELLGPTLLTAGPITDGDPPIWPGSTVATTAADGERAVMEQKAAGYDFIKVYSRLSLEAYDAIAAAATREQFVFAGHVPSTVPLAHALASGQKSIEHMTGYLAAVQRDGATVPAGASYTETIGVVAAGARADLILADANPLAGPIAIPPVGVVLGGKWHERSDLQARLDALKP